LLIFTRKPPTEPKQPPRRAYCPSERMSPSANPPGGFESNECPIFLIDPRLGWAVAPAVADPTVDPIATALASFTMFIRLYSIVVTP
jgi:hypothetical protein